MKTTDVHILFEKEGRNYLQLIQRDFIFLKLASILTIGTRSLLLQYETDHQGDPCTFGFWNTDTNSFRGLNTLFVPSEKVSVFKSFPYGDPHDTTFLTTLSFDKDSLDKHFDLLRILNLQDIVEVFNVSWSYMCLFHQQSVHGSVFGKYHHITQKFDEYVFCEPRAKGVPLKDIRETLRGIAYYNSGTP
jgi:hypothetical protein